MGGEKGDLVGNLDKAVKAAVFRVSEGPVWMNCPRAEYEDSPGKASTEAPSSPPPPFPGSFKQDSSTPETC